MEIKTIKLYINTYERLRRVSEELGLSFDKTVSYLLDIYDRYRDRELKRKKDFQEFINNVYALSRLAKLNKYTASELINEYKYLSLTEEEYKFLVKRFPIFKEFFKKIKDRYVIENQFVLFES